MQTFCLNVRETSVLKKPHLTVRVTEHWHRFPREVVESLFLQIVQKLSGCGAAQRAFTDPARAVGGEISPDVPASLSHSVIL